ncbi:MAG: T9SS type A sorting domain-containing protein [Armatimonadetes bacterium]|nr:T9SS type A sorting domain-containing protein [Armatimonadota bacterium]
MKKLLIILLFVSLIYSIFAQNPPDTLWTETFGGSQSDAAYSVQQTTDGDYIITGYSESYGAGDRDFWLVKIDENGYEIWNQHYGGIESDFAFSGQQTTDGGFIIIGYTSSYGVGFDDFWLVKTDENGNEEWNQTYGGYSYEWASSVQQTSDGGYIISGCTLSYGAGGGNFWLVKTDENGNEQWNQTYGGNEYEWASSVQQTTDGGYIIAGWTESYGAGGEDFWLVKTDENGNEQWNQTFGGNENDGALSVQTTTDGGYIVAGDTESFGAGGQDFWLVKTDENGIEEWNQTYGGDEWEWVYSVQQTTDEGYIIAGSTGTYGAGEHDFWLVKTDEDGNDEWNQTFGGNDNERAFSVQQTIDEGYIIAGFTYSYGAGASDAWLVLLDSEVRTENNDITSHCFLIQNYPNPFNPTTTISFSIQNNSNVELSIYNIKGQKVKTLISDQLSVGEHSVVWEGRDDDNLPVGSGIYFYQLKAENFEEIRKMILLK